MLIVKYICAVIALFSTLLFLSIVVSDITMSPASKSIDLNMSEDEVIKTSSAFRFILIIIMAITWPVIFIF